MRSSYILSPQSFVPRFSYLLDCPSFAPSGNTKWARAGESIVKKASQLGRVVSDSANHVSNPRQAGTGRWRPLGRGELVK